MLSKYGNCTRLRQIKTSLRSKRFRLVSEQKKDRGKGFSVMTKREPKSTIFRAVFDSCSSFFAPKPHRNACYAG